MISVVIPTYNRAKYLPQAIESVLEQTYRNFELIIWDDGSVDASPQIADYYAARDSRIKVILATHQGLTKSLKNAFALCKGKYISQVDSDDWIAPTCLEDTTQILNNDSSICLVYTYYTEVDENGKIIGLGKRCYVPYSKEALLRGHKVFHFRLMRRSTYVLAGGINEKYEYAQDYDLTLRLSEIKDFYQLQKPLYYYRIHQDRICEKFRNLQVKYAYQAICEAIDRRSFISK